MAGGWSPRTCSSYVGICSCCSCWSSSAILKGRCSVLVEETELACRRSLCKISTLFFSQGKKIKQNGYVWLKRRKPENGQNPIQTSGGQRWGYKRAVGNFRNEDEGGRRSGILCGYGDHPLLKRTK